MRNLPAPLRTAIVVLFLAGCAPVAAPENAYDPRDLRFSGDETLAIEADFVEHFPETRANPTIAWRPIGWRRD